MKNTVHFRKACMARRRRCTGSQHTFEDSGSEARCSDSQMPGSLSQGSKGKSESEYVISNSKGTVLTETQFVRAWKYITVRSTAERCYYTYVNGQSIKHRIKPRLGEHQPNNPKLVYTMDFKVTPHMLRHTYITNLIYKGVDPKTVQYLAGHENSKTTMDIYAKVKYNKPEELSSVVNAAFGLR